LAEAMRQAFVWKNHVRMQHAMRTSPDHLQHR
jgi:hypothetical protein